MLSAGRWISIDGAEELDKMLMGECMSDLKEGGTEAFQCIENENDAKELAFEIAKQFKE